MPAKIDICNLALNRIAANTIASLDEGTQSARAAALVYDVTLAELLEKHHWNFARTRRRLSRLALDADDLPPEWAFAYALPADMAKFMYFETAHSGFAGRDVPSTCRPSTRLTRWPGTGHEIIGDRIFSNADDGIVLYTARITDTAKFPAAFSAALVEMLAARMIMPIKGDERRYLAMRDSAARELNLAIASDLNNQDLSISTKASPSIFEQARR